MLIAKCFLCFVFVNSIYFVSFIMSLNSNFIGVNSRSVHHNALPKVK